MDTQLSYFSVSIFIASGILVVLFIFIFGKRQITRFTAKSARGPHLPTGHGAPKVIRGEIQCWLERLCDITYEPRLIHDKCEAMPASVRDSGITCNYKYRMLALDALSVIDVTVAECNDNLLKRNSTIRLRSYLILLYRKGLLPSAPMDLLRNFSDIYDHARHRPDNFGQAEYDNYIELLQLVLTHLEEGIRERLGHSRHTLHKMDTRVTLGDGSQKDIVTLPVKSAPDKRTKQSENVMTLETPRSRKSSPGTSEKTWSSTDTLVARKER